MNNLRVEYASACFYECDHEQKTEAALDFCEKQGWAFGIQIHNSISADWIKTMQATGLPLSYHGPLLSEPFMNLAHEDFSIAKESAARTANIASHFGEAMVVFHGFLMADTPVPIFKNSKDVHVCMISAYRPELAHNEMNLPAAIKTLLDNGLSHLVIETSKAKLQDLETSAQWLD